MPDFLAARSGSLDPHALMAIQTVVQTYLDGLYEGDAEKLAASFHPQADLRSLKPDGTLAVMPRAEWIAMVRSRPAPAAQSLSRHDRILSIDLAGPDMVVVKLNCAIPPRFFTDCLVLLKLAEGWRIVSKVFRTDVRG